MHFINNIAALTAMLATIAVAAPAPAPAAAAADAAIDLPSDLLSQYNATVGEVGSVRAGDSVEKRASIPAECSFEGTRSDYAYVQLHVDGHTSCMGWENSGYNDCGNGAWSEQEYINLYAALTEQVAQDGWNTHSQVGAWYANFFIGTTAFNDRGSAVLFYGYQNLFGYGKDAKHKVFYFSFDGNFVTMSRDSC
jgi:hypothetical protein